MKVVIEGCVLHDVRKGNTKQGKEYTVAVLRNYETFEEIELFGARDCAIGAKEGDKVLVTAIAKKGEKAYILNGFTEIVKVAGK